LSQDSDSPLSSTTPLYYTLRPAATVAGVAHQTLAKHLAPDARYGSIKGDKQFPLWSAESLAAFRARWANGEISGGAQ
jgi:hypothetical protein